MILRLNSCTAMARCAMSAAMLLASVLMIAIAPARADAMGVSYTAYRTEGAVTGRLVQAHDFIERGETLAIHIKYMNDGASVVSPGWIVFSLPEGCGLAPDSGISNLSVSVDGGRRFGQLSRLVIEDKGHARPAGAADVTHVRLQLRAPLAPGAGGEVHVMAALR